MFRTSTCRGHSFPLGVSPAQSLGGLGSGGQAGECGTGGRRPSTVRPWWRRPSSPGSGGSVSTTGRCSSRRSCSWPQPVQGVRLVPFRRLVPHLGAVTTDAPPRSVAAGGQPARIGRAVHALSRPTPWRTQCLTGAIGRLVDAAAPGTSRGPAPRRADGGRDYDRSRVDLVRRPLRGRWRRSGALHAPRCLRALRLMESSIWTGGPRSRTGRAGRPFGLPLGASERPRLPHLLPVRGSRRRRPRITHSPAGLRYMASRVGCHDRFGKQRRPSREGL